MFLVRIVPADGFYLEAYGAVPPRAWLLLDVVLQSLEDHIDGLLGIELTPASVVLESITGDVGIVLLTTTEPVPVARSVRRVFGSHGVEGVHREDVDGAREELEDAIPEGAILSRGLDVLGRDWCVLGAGTALLSGGRLPAFEGIHPEEVRSWDSFSGRWHRARRSPGGRTSSDTLP
ncbi:hypothetical protein [Methanopyrus sp.]